MTWFRRSPAFDGPCAKLVLGGNSCAGDSVAGSMGSNGSGSTGSEDGAGADNAIGPVAVAVGSTGISGVLDSSETVALVARDGSGMATLVVNSTRSGAMGSSR